MFAPHQVSVLVVRRKKGTDSDRPKRLEIMPYRDYNSSKPLGALRAWDEEGNIASS
jgi:hypothetical protein